MHECLFLSFFFLKLLLLKNTIVLFLKEPWLTHSHLASLFTLLPLKHLYISNIAFWLQPQKADSFVKHHLRNQTAFSMHSELIVLKQEALKSLL